MSINLEGLNQQELDALITAAAEQKKKLHRVRINDVRNRIIALARDEGYSIEELFGDGKARSSGRSRGSVAPKYRDPASGATWTGRGKQPRWVQAFVAAGNSLEGLLIR